MFLTKTQTAKYADVMLWALKSARHGTAFKPYDVILLRYKPLALPLAEVLTPNIPEAEILSGMSIANAADMEAAARTISERSGCGISSPQPEGYSITANA